MKKWVVVSAAAVMLVSAAWTMGDAGEVFRVKTAQAAGETQMADKRTVSVNGEGEITITPDVAYVQLGVQTRADTAIAAQESNAKAFAAVEKVLYEQYGIDKKDVKTTGFNVNPDYSYQENKAPQITGYTAQNLVTVTYRDLEKLGGLLDAVSKAGANRIDHIQFSTEKGEEYELQAMEKAMANAEAKAKVLAKYAGRDLKGILHINQSGAGTPVAYRASFATAEKAMFDMASPSSSVAPGELKVKVNVNVTFEF
ncbi:SIMPL domain-containing protein [Paenibacillus turpanensis]|uniref:SIMPL domain-containing protein n=1 Tax=Paenibacillus turpanensis TaxID=2689078 RepID=UPI001409D672|nr:SIMPL domain-containing protein [Paenibacillus turpanensis]